MTPHRSIAAAQTVPVRGDVEANVEQHLRLTAFAAREQAQICVFPELSLTGYELDLAKDLAFSPEDARLEPLVEAACRYDMTLVAGAPVKIEERLHIGAFILSPDRTVSLYTKRHLGAFSSDTSPDGVVPPAENTVFDPGTLDPLVRLGDHRAALAVCADTSRASHPRRAAERGATTYLAGVFFVPSHLESMRPVLGGYAGRHSMAVAVANYGGPTGGLAAGGGSAIWSQQGELLARLAPSGSGVVVAAESSDGWRTKAIPVGENSVSTLAS